MCSYNSPTFLFPPLELISVAGTLRTIDGVMVSLHDSIAENTTIEEVCKYISKENIDVIISLSGFECFESDMDMLKYIRRQLPNVKQILFGYYPTEFPEQILKHTEIDVLLLGEPEYPALEIITAWKTGCDNKIGIKGIALRNNEEFVIQENTRVTHLNDLPMPAFDLLKIKYYSEPFLPQPFGMIQSARGCPYKCNYCVRSYGTKLSALHPEVMIAQVKEYIRLFNIKSFRFIDDTFTATPARVIRFCQLLEQEKIYLQWSCLSRADTMNEEMLNWMYKTGCRNIYIGMESGSQKILDFYNKNIDIDKAVNNLRLCKKIGFRMMGLFMVSPMEETEDDVKKSIALAKRAEFDYISVFELQTYPGTELYEKMKDSVVFTLFPYVNRFKDEALNQRKMALQKYFYKSWYYRPGYLLQKLPDAVKFTNQAVKGGALMSKFLITGLQRKGRKDFI